MNRMVRILLSHLLADAVILLCLPIDLLGLTTLFVNHSRHDGSGLSSANSQTPAQGLVALYFLFWLDAGFVARYGLTLCIAAALLWLLLLVLGQGIAPKVVALAFLIPAVIFIWVGRAGALR